MARAENALDSALKELTLMQLGFPASEESIWSKVTLAWRVAWV